MSPEKGAAVEVVFIWVYYQYTKISSKDSMDVRPLAHRSVKQFVTKPNAINDVRICVVM
jgi:hypothetical protein